jgi:CheY-like chemotaxis protein
MNSADFQTPLVSGTTECFLAEEILRCATGPSSHSAGSVTRNQKRQKVLVVDDQRLIADTLAEILSNAGFDAIPAYDGWDALDKVSRFRPHWIITDVLMPNMNGVELAIAIRKNHPQSAILLFSGQAGISDILREGQRQGYQFELIAKPVHPLKLIERLKGE